jgi:hypothetical protein
MTPYHFALTRALLKADLGGLTLLFLIAGNNCLQMLEVAQPGNLKNDIETSNMLFGQLSYLLHLNGDSIKTLRIYTNLLAYLSAAALKQV